MPWTLFLIAVALVVLVVMSGRWLTQLPARDVAQALRVFAATLAVLMSSGLMYAGRVGFAVAALGAAFWAFRSFRQAQRPPDTFGPAESASTDTDGASVVTETLRMRLDPATGALDGEVRTGPFGGQRLSRLTLDQLRTLLAGCRRDDPESEPLLEAFLDRRHQGWREEAPADDTSGAMTDARAYDILGLEPGASEVDVKAAHRRLMAGLHPDQGGSNFLASQINAARAHLLERGTRRR
ncbi:MAG: DnaJ domain-containing protein [Pseudomonadota bacterium]